MNSSAHSVAIARQLGTSTEQLMPEPPPATTGAGAAWPTWVHAVWGCGALLSGGVFLLQSSQLLAGTVELYLASAANVILLFSLYFATIAQMRIQPVGFPSVLLALHLVAVSSQAALLPAPAVGLMGAMVLVAISLLDLGAQLRRMLVAKFTSSKLSQIFESKFPVLKVLSDVGTLELRGGAWIRVGAGERVPVDGSVISGEGVLSGCVGAGYLGARVCRVGDPVSAGEFLEEGTLAIAVERSWPYHRCAARARFAEHTVTGGKIDVQPQEQLPAAIAASIILLTAVSLVSGHPMVAAFFGCFGLVLHGSLQFPLFSLYAMVVATAYRAGIGMRSSPWVHDIATCDGVVIAPEAFEAPVVRRRAVLSSAIDADHLDAVLVNLLGAAPDSWARTLTTYLKERTKKLSHLCGVKGYRRISAGGIRGEFDGAQIVVGDEATIRGQGIALEVSEAQPSAPGITVVLVAVAGEVVEKFEIEALPLAEFAQQAAREFDRGLFAELKARQKGRWVGEPPPGDGFLIRASTALGTISLAEAIPDIAGRSAAQQELFSRDDMRWQDNEVLRLLVPEAVLKVLPLIRRCKLLSVLREVLISCSIATGTLVLGSVGLLMNLDPLWMLLAVTVVPVILIARDLFALLVAAERL